MHSRAEVSPVGLRQRSNFAVQHLMGAARFSRQCGEIQEQNRGESLGDFYDAQIACLSATVMLCVASLESNINEHLAEPETTLRALPASAQAQFIELIEPKPILAKYQRVLMLNELEPFDRGAQPYQDVSIIIAMRNELLHFHPEFHDAQERHHRLGEQLKNKFELSPFIAEGVGVVFPQRIVSHGCTRWAVESALRFMVEFSERAGLKNSFELFESKCHG